MLLSPPVARWLPLWSAPSLPSGRGPRATNIAFGSAHLARLRRVMTGFRDTTTTLSELVRSSRSPPPGRGWLTLAHGMFAHVRPTSYDLLRAFSPLSEDESPRQTTSARLASSVYLALWKMRPTPISANRHPSYEHPLDCLALESPSAVADAMANGFHDPQPRLGRDRVEPRLTPILQLRLLLDGPRCRSTSKVARCRRS